MQTKFMSFTEVLISTLIGLVVAFIATQAICFAYGIPMSYGANAILTFWMTVVSIVRSYLIRRFFNRFQTRK